MIYYILSKREKTIRDPLIFKKKKYALKISSFVMQINKLDFKAYFQIKFHSPTMLDK